MSVLLLKLLCSCRHYSCNIPPIDMKSFNSIHCCLCIFYSLSCCLLNNVRLKNAEVRFIIPANAIPTLHHRAVFTENVSQFCKFVVSKFVSYSQEEETRLITFLGFHISLVIDNIVNLKANITSTYLQCGKSDIRYLFIIIILRRWHCFTI